MQVTGEMELEGGGRIIMRGFGRFNISLWDAVLAELEPITEADTILVNFGSWYNRLYIDDGAAQWEGWKADMQELVEQRLARTRGGGRLERLHHLPLRRGDRRAHGGAPGVAA